MASTDDADDLPLILAVDDEKPVILGLTRQLRGFCTMAGTFSGQEGLEFLEHNENVAGIISDYRMPGMNGIEFLQQAALIQPDAARIILTGWGDELRLSDALDGRIVDKVLNKPCPKEELIDALLGLLKDRVKALVPRG